MTELAVDKAEGVEIRGPIRPGYDDEVAKVLSAGQASTIALEDSTEAAQF